MWKNESWDTLNKQNLIITYHSCFFVCFHFMTNFFILLQFHKYEFESLGKFTIYSNIIISLTINLNSQSQLETLLPLVRRGGGGLSFKNFCKKGGSDFYYKKGGVGEIGGCFKKRGYHLFSY